VSCTIFLSDPTTYEGGELTVYIGDKEFSAKGKAGSAIFYPSTTIHEVKAVTAGSRLVILSFIESFIADQLQRDLYYTLAEVAALEGLKMHWRSRIRLEYVKNNLVRMWSA